MELFILFILVTVFGLLSNLSMFERLNEVRRYKPAPDVRVGLNAMKNLVLFALIFAALYWLQVQFGDAEVWTRAFQRN